jgi:hypothetical protein
MKVHKPASFLLSEQKGPRVVVVQKAILLRSEIAILPYYKRAWLHFEAFDLTFASPPSRNKESKFKANAEGISEYWSLSHFTTQCVCHLGVRRRCCEISRERERPKVIKDLAAEALLGRRCNNSRRAAAKKSPARAHPNQGKERERAGAPKQQAADLSSPWLSYLGGRRSRSQETEAQKHSSHYV